MKNYIKYITLFVLFFSTSIYSQVVDLSLPQNRAVNQQAKALYFEWHSVPNAVYYQFEVSDRLRFEEQDIIMHYDRIDTNIVIAELDNYRTYYWRVRVQENEWSEVWSFTTTGLPRVPILYKPLNDTINIDTGAVFTWNFRESNTSYNFEISPSGNFSYNVKRRTVKDTSFYFGGLEHNTRYYWRVQGENPDNELSYWSSVFAFNTALPLPEYVSPSDSARYIPLNTKLKWAEVTEAEMYHIIFSDDSTFATSLVDKKTDKLALALPRLTPNKDYFWKLRAYRADSVATIWSNVFRFHTNPGLFFDPTELKDTLNFSPFTSNILRPVIFNNQSNSAVRFDSIYVWPDTLFTLSHSDLILEPNEMDSVFTVVDTSKIDSLSSLSGSISFYEMNDGFIVDSLKIAINVLVLKAIAKINKDTLDFDSTLASSSTTKNFYLVNNGNTDLRIREIFFNTSGESSFKVVQSPKFVAPFDSSIIGIKFKPDSVGNHFDRVNVLTNSYPDSIISLELKASGYGPAFSKNTWARFNQLGKTEFETFNNNFLPLGLENNGTRELQLTVGFENNYYELFDQLEKTFKILPNNSDTLILKYLTPNFDPLNVDSLKIWHNSFGKNPISIPLTGSHDEKYSALLMQGGLKINNQAFIEKDYIFPEKTTINFFLDPKVLEDYDNLKFRLKYFVGGPGPVKTANAGGSNNYIIPYQNVKNNGLLFYSELVTADPKYNTEDSSSVFGYLNGQVVSSKYSTPVVSVPYSKSSTQVNNVNPSWVLFGFPTGDVIADSVFSYFGGRENMKDGEWMVYKYGENGFEQFDDYYFEPNKGYFVAQALTNELVLSYTYENDILSRKLTDTLFTVQGSGWRAISNPFTFDVQVDSSTILYTYDTNNKAYRVTKIMRSGHAYFVDGSVSEVKLQTFGEYYPDLFPKIVGDNDIAITIDVDTENSNQQIIVGKRLGCEVLAKQAPKIGNGVDVYVKNDSGAKSILDMKNFTEGKIWDLVLESENEEENFEISFDLNNKIQNEILFNIIDNSTLKSLNVNRVSGHINKGETKTYKILMGTNDFINKAVDQIENSNIDKFYLSQNYPNPFNPTTKISYTIPNTVVDANFASTTKLVVYNLLGEEISVLVNKIQTPGNYEIEFDGSRLTSGVYFYQLKVGDKVDTKKMVLLK